jgi:hypothetical protein
VNKFDLAFEMTTKKDDLVVWGREGNVMAGIFHHVGACQCVEVELVRPGPSPIFLLCDVGARRISAYR